MRELTVLTFMSLDGVMQGPSSPEEDKSGGFTQGGWAAEYWPEVMEQVEREAMAEPFDIIFGRRTYEMFARHWPNAPVSDHGQKLNEATKFVATSTLDVLEWQPSVAIRGNVAEEIGKLKAQSGPTLQVHGSCQLIHSLMKHDLVDEFRLWIFPVVIGSGKRLFDESTTSTPLTLIRTETTGNGVIMAKYRCVRDWRPA